MAKWFETKVRFDKTMENGTVKKVTEHYLVDALSFTEAEAQSVLHTRAGIEFQGSLRQLH